MIQYKSKCLSLQHVYFISVGYNNLIIYFKLCYYIFIIPDGFSDKILLISYELLQTICTI